MKEDVGALTFEEAMKRLERIVADLEAGTFPLAESLQKFEEGLALGKHCRELLGRADLRVRTLTEAPDGAFGEGEPIDDE